MQRGEDEDEEEEEFEILNYYKIWLLCRHNFSLLSFSSTHFASDFFCRSSGKHGIKIFGNEKCNKLELRYEAIYEMNDKSIYG